MDFFDVVEGRHSVRAFKADAVRQEDMERILQAAGQAPSAGNLQAYEMYVVCDAGRKQALANAAGDQDFLAQPPLVLVFCAHPDRSAGRYEGRGLDLYCLQDATIACTFAMLAAAALGLATVWVGAFDEEDVRKIIGAPQAHRPVAILPVGYAAEIPEIRSRRSLQKLVHWVDS